MNGTSRSIFRINTLGAKTGRRVREKGPLPNAQNNALIRCCAWCHRDMETNVVLEDAVLQTQAITHGICQPCLDRITKEAL